MSLTTKRLAQLAVVLVVSSGCFGVVSAQERVDAGFHRFGLNAALNINMSAPGLQQLQAINPWFSATQPRLASEAFKDSPLIDGIGLAPYIGLFYEYHNPSKWWGIQARASYDVRSASVTDDMWSNFPGYSRSHEYDVNWSYLAIEPLLRLNLNSLTDGLYAVVGPYLGFKMASTYSFVPGDGQTGFTDVEVPGANSFIWGATLGAGYDIGVRYFGKHQLFISPFVDASLGFNQRASTFTPALDQNGLTDVWSTGSIRIGFHAKLELNSRQQVIVDGGDSDLNLSLIAPSGVIKSRKLDEFFPLLNYVFFDPNSSAIPSRYVTLGADDAKRFSENSLMEPAQVGNVPRGGHLDHQKSVYYNVLNIYGARLRENPASTVTLTGSDPDKKNALNWANAVKTYFVDNHGIDAARIKVEERATPMKTTASPDPADQNLRNNEERRNVLISMSPLDLRKPVQINAVEESPIENDLVFNLSDDTPVESWQVVIKGDKGTNTYGPYDDTEQHLDGATILGDLDKGQYTAEVVVKTTDGRVLSKQQAFELLKKPEPVKRAQRYAILFEFASDESPKTYENFLKGTVAQRTEAGSTVYIHGHTDIIGSEKANTNFSRKRAAETRDILSDEFKKTGKNVKFQVVGFGERQTGDTFDNALPEGRYYSRTVIIEVVPAD